MFINEPARAAKPGVLFLHQGGELYGSDLVFYQAVKALAPCVEPIIILDNAGPLVEKLREVSDRVEIFDLGVLRRKFFSPAGIFRNTFAILRSVFYLWRLIKRENIGLVYTNTIGVLPGAIVAKLTGKPHIWHIHEILVKPAWLAKILANLVLSLSRRVIANSNSTAQYLIRSGRGNTDRIAVVHNGIALERLQRSPESAAEWRTKLGLSDDLIVIGLIGRIHPFKGQDCIVDVACRMKSMGFENFCVLVIGDVYEGYEWFLEQIKAKIQELELTQHFYFCGYQQDIAGILSAVDISVVPSTLPESFGLVTVEAMAAAKPVVATALGGSTEIVVDGVTGFLVPVNEPAQMAQRLIQLARDPKLRQTMGERGRERALTLFSLERFEKGIRQSVQEILNTASDQPGRTTHEQSQIT